MATSRTGTALWKSIAKRRKHTAQQQGITHCPTRACGVWLDYTQGKKPNSAEVDHIVPHAQGGTDTYENTQILCRRCNQSQGAKQPPKRRTRVPSITF